MLLKFEHNDPWNRIKVWVDLGDSNFTCFQTRSQNVYYEV